MALAMDWGGTWCRIAVVAQDGRILWQSRARNAAGADREQLLAAGAGLVEQAMAWCGASHSIAGLGIAAAGPVDSSSGTLREPPNLPLLNGVSLKQEWEPRFNLPVHVGNDATLAALGEYVYGAGPEARDYHAEVNSLVYITVSTGVGGGVVERGRLLLGSQGLAAEIGHMVIDWRPDAPMCQCGNRGCLEAFASGTAIARTARQRVADRPQGVLAGMEPDSITSGQVFEAAEAGDPLASGILEEVIESLTVGLTNLLHLFNPDLIVMGGGVTFGLVRMGLLPRLHDQVSRRAMTDGHRNFHLVPSRLGDAPGLLGAASLAWGDAEG